MGQSVSEVQASVQTPGVLSAGLWRHEKGLLHIGAAGSQVSKKVAGRFLSRQSSSSHVEIKKVTPSRVTLDHELILDLAISLIVWSIAIDE